MDAPAAAPAETAGTMRTFSKWLEDKLAEEPKPKVRMGRKWWTYQWISGAVVGIVWPLLIWPWHWLPVWAFLFVFEFALGMHYAVRRVTPPSWALTLSLAFGVWFTVYVW
jgi:hypothetical protein